MAMKFGGATIAENLKRAVSAQKLIENADGTLRQPPRPESEADHWIFVTHGTPMKCGFLMNFVFKNAYARSAVPYGCSQCYKIKVTLRTLRELVAAWQVGQSIECNSKWGIDFYNQYSQDIYAGYFFATGLDATRVLFKTVRETVDRDPKLGPDVRITIKRGCSEYEVKLGPPRLPATVPPSSGKRAHAFARWRNATSPASTAGWKVRARPSG